MYVDCFHATPSIFFFTLILRRYTIMENMRYMLNSYENTLPIYFGSRFKKFTKQGYMSGGKWLSHSRLKITLIIILSLLPEDRGYVRCCNEERERELEGQWQEEWARGGRMKGIGREKGRWEWKAEWGVSLSISSSVHPLGSLQPWGYCVTRRKVPGQVRHSFLK